MNQYLADIIANHHTFLLDASGVIYNDYGPFKGTASAIRLMQQKGHVFVVTNNSFNSPHSISTRLSLSNIKIDPKNIISSGHGLFFDKNIHSLIQKKIAYVYGSEDSHYYVKKASVSHITKQIDMADIVIMTASYKGDNVNELNIIRDALTRRPNLPIICCNPDRIVMSKKGLKPVIGHFAEQLEILNKARLHWVGKPLKNFNDIVKGILENKHKITVNKDVCFFDDNIENTQNMAHTIGTSSCWVKNTGIFQDSETRPLIKKYGHPDYIIKQLSF